MVRCYLGEVFDEALLVKPCFWLVSALFSAFFQGSVWEASFLACFSSCLGSFLRGFGRSSMGVRVFTSFFSADSHT